jgi:hypothetical protein
MNCPKVNKTGRKEVLSEPSGSIKKYLCLWQIPQILNFKS